MNKINFKKSERALVIVAHPDDETIWMSGTILKYNGMEWTIFSLCRSDDNDRAPKFFRVCKLYGAAGIMTDLEDEGRMSLEVSIPAIRKLIREEIKNKKYHYIFTHGANGEYGHLRHKGVHQAVKKMVLQRELEADMILYFDYVKNTKGGLPLIAVGKNPDLTVKLDSQLFKRKKKVMTDIYGFDPQGIDANYCTNPEAFKIFNNKNMTAAAKASAV
jgi:LmbE family N-acetylglucosaminyl deacetylase